MFKKLLKNLPQQYQDIDFEGYQSGVRTCDTRYEMIKNYLPEGVVLDIGSAQGYFVKKFASEDRLMISLENKKQNIDLQKYLFKYDKNIILLHKTFNYSHFELLNESVTPIDGILCLSILHHFNRPDRVVRELSKLSPTVIVEIPHENEHNACGILSRSIINENLLETYFDTIKKIGEAPSHVNSGIKRSIYLCTSKIHKTNLKSYFSNKELARKNHVLRFNKKWLLNGEEIKSGVNFHDLTKLGLVEQRVGMYKEQAIRVYQDLGDIKIFDMRLWNLVIGPSGMFAVDYKYQDRDEFLPATRKDWESLEKIF